MRGLEFAVTAIASAAVISISGVLSVVTNIARDVNFAIALVGIYLAIIIPLAASYYGEPVFDIVVGTPVIAPDGSSTILKVDVVSKRNFVKDPRPSVTFYAGGPTYTISGKWDSQPEPLLVLPQPMGGDIFQGWLTRVEHSVDILPKQKEALAIANKFNGEKGFYGFDAWSYATRKRHFLVKIDDLTRVEVKVEIRSGDITKSKRFIIENPNTSINGFYLRDKQADTKIKAGELRQSTLALPEADELEKKRKLVEFIATLSGLLGIMFAVISSASKEFAALFGFFVVIQVVASLLAYSKLLHEVRWNNWWRVGYVFDSGLISVSFSSLVILALGYSLAQVLAYSALTADSAFGLYAIVILVIAATFWFVVFRELALHEPGNVAQTMR